MPAKLTTKEFIEKAIKIHGDKYDYSLVDYKKTREKIKIICKIHGKFEQKPNTHLNKSGCEKCGYLIKKSNIKEFIEKAIKIHDNKYNYDKVIYNNSKEKILILCNIHGEFLQIPTIHLKGIGCIKCKQLENFIKICKLKYGEKYDYKKVNYIGIHTKVIISCKVHGDFLQTPANHYNYNGCSQCSINGSCLKRMMDINEFIIRANLKHNNRYDYSKVKYKNIKSKIIIICKIHGDFKQEPKSHLFGQGCPNCINKTEGKLLNILQDNYYYSDIITQFKIDNCKNQKHLPFDFLIKEHKIIIELDGQQHFKLISNWKSPEEIQKRDKYKMQCANDNDYSVIRIFQEDVWNDSFNWFEMLEDSIEYIVYNKIVANIFISKNNNLYKDYI